MNPGSPLYKLLVITGLLFSLMLASLCLVFILPLLGDWVGQFPFAGFALFFSLLLAKSCFIFSRHARNHPGPSGSSGGAANMRIKLPPKNPLGGLKAAKELPGDFPQ